MLLREKDRQTLLQIFSSVTLPVEVWAFGSRVDGNAHSGSDLDLVVFTRDKKKFPAEVLMKFREKITESNIPILVDLFDWDRLPENFHINIEAKYEVLFSNFQTIANEPTAEYKKQDNDGTKSNK